MQRFVTRIIAGAALLGLCGGSAFALPQAAPAKNLLVRNPPSGNRGAFYKAKPTAPLAGNPTVDGATFNLQLSPGGTQCFQLPASGWRSIGPALGPVRGYRYDDHQLLNGPIKVALILKKSGGTLLVKVKARGPAVTVIPGNPTLTYGVNFSVKGTGDQYCASTGTATPAPNSATTFHVGNDNNGACTLAACSPSGAFLDGWSTDVLE